MPVIQHDNAGRLRQKNGSGNGRPKQRSLPRKKACEQCSMAKVRCDQRRDQCAKCEKRGLHCSYTTPLTRTSGNSGTSGNNNEAQISPTQDSIAGQAPVSYDIPLVSSHPPSLGRRSNVRFPASSTPRSNTPSSWINQPVRGSNRFHDYGSSIEGYGSHRMVRGRRNSPIDFNNLDLVCTIDHLQMRNRWLNAFISSADQTPKDYPPSVMDFMSRVLRTYPTMLSRRGGLPPFIHPSQLRGPSPPTPLANCISLVRMWEGQVRGSESMVQETIRTEMRRLYETVRHHITKINR
jgi:hypothetical protein